MRDYQFWELKCEVGFVIELGEVFFGFEWVFEGGFNLGWKWRRIFFIFFFIFIFVRLRVKNFWLLILVSRVRCCIVNWILFISRDRYIEGMFCLVRLVWMVVVSVVFFISGWLLIIYRWLLMSLLVSLFSAWMFVDRLSRLFLLDRCFLSRVIVVVVLCLMWRIFLVWLLMWVVRVNFVSVLDMNVLKFEIFW